MRACAELAGTAAALAPGVPGGMCLCVCAFGFIRMGVASATTAGATDCSTKFSPPVSHSRFWPLSR